MPRVPKELIPRRNLDENRQVPSRRNRHANQRHFQAKELEVGLVEPETIVFALRIPPLELHDQLDALRCPRRGNPEQIAQIDHTDPAHFHVMPGEFRTAADDDRRCSEPNLHGIVCNQPMSTNNQVERALALSDTALTDYEDAQSENVEEHAMDHFADGQSVLEECAQFADRRCRTDPVLSKGTPARSAASTKS